MIEYYLLLQVVLDPFKDFLGAENWFFLNHKTPSGVYYSEVQCMRASLVAGQETTVRTGHGTTDWFQIGKGVCQGCILSPCLFNLYAKYIM